jgi:hypothetical protein
VKEFLLGTDTDTGRKVYVPKKSFDTHWHLIGGTGKGKTTAVHTLLHGMFRDPTVQDCWFVIDRMGGLSYDLLLWFTSPFCPQFVRDRVVYVEPANEDVVLGFNPLVYSTPQHGYYKVGRATDVVLRAWEGQDVGQMPRLARWVFNAFWAAAQLGLTVADCGHIFNPASGYHRPILDALPPLLRGEWADILRAKGKAVEILDSSRNRLKPYFEAPVLRRTFGTSQNHLDVHRLMREGRIVVVNLANKNRIGPQIADAIGGLVINEVLATARGLEPWERFPTYLLLDEFQRFVGPDLEEALPEVRQMQIRLILAHQSLSQLEQGDTDLRTMIFQAQSRMIFGLQGRDADDLAVELASLHFDPKKIKDEIWQRRQKQIGHRIEKLKSWSESESESKNWNETWGRGWKKGESKTTDLEDYTEQRSEQTGTDEKKGGGSGGGRTTARVTGESETLVPEFEEYLELASRTYYSFEDEKQVWARKVREERTGEAFLRVADVPGVKSVAVKRSAPGHLRFSATELYRMLPQVHEAVERFKEENFRSDYFRSPADVDRETDERLKNILAPPIAIRTPAELPQPAPDDEFGV